MSLSSEILQQMGVPFCVRRDLLFTLPSEKLAPSESVVELVYAGPQAKWLFIEPKQCDDSILAGNAKTLFKNILQSLQVDVREIAIAQAAMQSNCVLKFDALPTTIHSIVTLGVEEYGADLFSSCSLARHFNLPHPYELLAQPSKKRQFWYTWWQNQSM